jgi:pimeloyl-ACP methyl ester carboxylesterase
VQPQPFPQADGTEGIEFIIDPAAFHALFAADVPTCVAAAMASAERPLTLAGNVEKSTAPAWKTIPSWYLIGRQDRVFSAEAQRFMARRAHAHTVEIDSSHAIYVSPGRRRRLHHPGRQDRPLTGITPRAGRRAGTGMAAPARPA